MTFVIWNIPRSQREEVPYLEEIRYVVKYKPPIKLGFRVFKGCGKYCYCWQGFVLHLSQSPCLGPARTQCVESLVLPILYLAHWTASSIEPLTLVLEIRWSANRTFLCITFQWHLIISVLKKLYNRPWHLPVIIVVLFLFFPQNVVGLVEWGEFQVKHPTLTGVLNVVKIILFVWTFR